MSDCQPASRIIDKVGGTAKVAAATGREESAVRRWRLTKPTGTGGVIPPDAVEALLRHAEANGIDLTWDDFRPASISNST